MFIFQAAAWTDGSPPHPSMHRTDHQSIKSWVYTLSTPRNRYVLIWFPFVAVFYYLSGLGQYLNISASYLLAVRLSSGGVLLVPAAVVLEHGQYAKRLAGLNGRLNVLRLHGNHYL